MQILETQGENSSVINCLLVFFESAEALYFLLIGHIWQRSILLIKIK